MPADILNKERNFVSRAINASEDLLEAMSELENLKREFQELNYGASFTEDIFEGDLAHLDIAALVQLSGAIQATAQMMDSGNRAIFLRMRR